MYINTILDLISCDSVWQHDPSCWFEDIHNRNLKCILCAEEGSCVQWLVFCTLGLAEDCQYSH